MSDDSNNRDKVFFIIGSPRSGSTLLARMIGSHSRILTRGEPHMLTPLAHLGYYEKVEKAPYDAILAAESMKEFVAEMPGGEQDYIDACRAYADTLYLRYLGAHPGKDLFLDKTPAYSLILDFMARIYPQARYVVLTRHPLAIFSSFAESFFDSDYQAAHDYNPICERYVPAIAKFIREAKTPLYHVVYEKLVEDPAPVLSEVFDFLGLDDESSDAVDYGKHEYSGKGLGDPIGVAKHSRPTTASIHKWAGEIAADPARLELCRNIIDRLDPEDLAIWGHPLETIWQPLEEAGAAGAKPKSKKLDRYRLQRKAIVRLRKAVGQSAALRRMLEKMRLGADILLRD